MKKITSLLITLCLIAGLAVPLASSAQAARFSDVPASHWAYSYIEELSSKKIIDGMGNGKFVPGGTLTRAQFIKLLTCIPGLTGGLSGCDVSDVAKTSWAYPYVTEGFYRGIVTYSELSNKRFLPNQAIDRKTAALWMMRMLGAFSETSKTEFTDFTYTGDETSKAVATAQSMGLVTGYPDGSFHPGGKLTRAEAASIVKRALDKYTAMNAPLRETDVEVYQPGIKQLSSGSNNVLQSVDEGSGVYVFTNIDDTMRSLRTGEGFVIKPCTALPSGLAIKVKTISVSGDTATITRDVTQVSDIFKHLDVKSDKYVTADDVLYQKCTSGVTLLQSPANASLQSGVSESDNHFKLGVDMVLGEGGNSVDFDGMVTSGGTIKIKGTITFSIKPRMEFGDNNNYDLRVNIDVKNDVKLTGSYKHEIKLPIYEVGFKAGPLGSATAGIYLDLDAEGNISVGVTRSDGFAVGGSYENGNFIFYRQNINDTKYNAEVTATVKFGPKAEINLKFLGGLLGAKLSAMGGAKADMKLESLNLLASGKVTMANATPGGDVQKVSDTELKYHACTFCVKGSLNGFAEISGKLSAAYGILNLSQDFLIESPGVQFHISAQTAFGMGPCDNYKSLKLAADTSWKKVYSSYIESHIDNDAAASRYRLIDVNGDSVPELYRLGGSTASGDSLCTVYNGKLVELHGWNYGFSAVPKKNSVCESGGHMDEYHDKIYSIENGAFVLKHDGEYGAPDNSHVQVDASGNPIYIYKWDGAAVTKSVYNADLNAAFDSASAVKAYADTYSADQMIKIIETPCSA